MKDVIKCLKYIVNALDGFSEEEIQALINGRAKLSVIYNSDYEHEKPKGKKVNGNYDVEPICSEIDKLSSVDEVHKYLDELKPAKAVLREIAKHYNVSFTTKDTNDALKNKIVDGTIGAKIKFKALLNTEI